MGFLRPLPRPSGMAAPLHGDVALAIGQQVEQMIYQAKMDSEARVRHDISAARSQLQHMEGLIVELSDRVARCVRSGGPAAGGSSQMVDRAFLSQKISQLEQKWGSEVKALKQDLHRTILAHNHNSDLMRHHRDALDEARRRLDAQQPPRAAQVDAQIERVDRMLRAGQAKQRTLDALAERLLALEGQVGAMLPPYPGAAAGAAAATPVMSARRGDEPPTQEEVRNRLLQAAARNSPAVDTAFNAAAPVFVPGGAGSSEAPAAEGAAEEGDDGAEDDEQAGGGAEEGATTAAEGAGGTDEDAEALPTEPPALGAGEPTGETAEASG